MTERHPARRPRHVPPEELRVSDDGRERTVRFLQRAYRRGRISLEELDERSQAAYGATTRADLYVLVRDLPGHRHLSRRPPRRRRGFWRTLAAMFGFGRRRR
jgi:hypothetical protein